MHHVGIQVTGAAGADLDRGYTAGTDAVGIVFRFKIPFNDGDPELVSQ